MRVNERGRITIPISIRNALGILPNTEIEFVVSGKEVILRKITKRPRGAGIITALRGRANSKLTTNQIMALTRGN